VRDRIPDIIPSEGYTPRVRILEEVEYISELNRKLREETEEYLSDDNPEEIADILEVIEAICAAKGYTQEQIETIKAQKKAERGGFEKKLYLESKE
jgi:predicted house-cleaning noncanonical NTP pyrophosphatase (MazG superfamily)